MATDRELLKSIIEKIDSIKTETDSLKKILLSNGGPGLCEQVRNNQKSIDGNADKINDIENHLKNVPNKYRSWLTFGLTIFTAAGVIGSFITMLVRR